ncbi:uncharacterized protein H6S33_004233 [Morchella sextelata]|uniref:uncharacterized protein n=1 Tax=Morchella sextelata TaxID=1174677 RepID=UPI001D046272|nr:uncharacterized protein H6S33_004233 [Morchella sextelata]KAH0605776.1 hypothetical protein H6S33_004233 [Morchella sextelata]
MTTTPQVTTGYERDNHKLRESRICGTYLSLEERETQQARYQRPTSYIQRTAATSASTILSSPLQPTFPNSPPRTNAHIGFDGFNTGNTRATFTYALPLELTARMAAESEKQKRGDAGR